MTVSIGPAWSLIFVGGLSSSSCIFSGSELSDSTVSRASIARREPEPGSSKRTSHGAWSRQAGGIVALEPTGELLHLEASQKHYRHQTHQLHDLWDRKNSAKDVVQNDDLNTSQLCGIEFALGQVNGTNCSDTSSEELIGDPSLCEFAGLSAFPNFTHAHFEIPSDYFNLRPKGCFAYPCSEHSSGVCYFYNGVAEWPHADDSRFGGRPVCVRQRFLHGINDGTSTTCPHGYFDIEDSATCIEFADCRYHCKGTPFDVSAQNYSQHHEFPEGCFIRESDGCVYYNPKDDLQPERPKGQPICGVKTIHGLTKDNLWTYDSYS